MGNEMYRKVDLILQLISNRVSHVYEIDKNIGSLVKGH